jgi:hypothetical protein
MEFAEISEIKEIKENKILLPKTLQNNDLAKELVILPNALNEVEEKIIKKEKEIVETKFKIELIENQKKKIAFADEKNTNKEKRDLAIKEETMKDINYIEFNQKLINLLTDKDNLEIELKFFYNRFSSIKYLVRLLECNNNE